MAKTALARLLDGTGRPDWQVAAELGIHPTLVSLYRNGHRRPSARHLIVLAEYFQVEPSRLTDDRPAELEIDDHAPFGAETMPVPADPAEWID